MKKTTFLLIVVLASQPSLSAEKQKATILVTGMHCSSCVSMVKKAVRKVQGLEGVSVSLDSAKVDIEYTDDRALPDAIAAITRMGYKVTNVDSVGRTVEKATH